MKQESSAIIKEIFQLPEFHESLKAAVSFVMDEKRSTKEPDPIYYTREDLKRILHLSYVSIDRYTDLGILEARRIGSRILYSRDAVEKGLQKVSRVKYKKRA